MPQFWSSMHAWMFSDMDSQHRQDHSSFLNILTACFTSRSEPSEPSDLDIHTINYESRHIIIFDNDAGYYKPMQLHQLQNMNLDSLKDFYKENEPPEGRPRDHPEFYNTNRVPTTWNELLKSHRAWWDQRKASSAKPSQVDQPPPLSQNHSPDDRETRTTTEVEARRSINSLYGGYWA
jgi:hypothetical protein